MFDFHADMISLKTLVINIVTYPVSYLHVCCIAVCCYALQKTDLIRSRVRLLVSCASYYKLLVMICCSRISGFRIVEIKS